MSRADDTGPGVELDALVAAYAFDALEGRERADVEELLRRSPALVARLAEFQGAVASWGSGTSATPPAALRERVLAAVDGIAQLPAGEGRTAADAVLAEPSGRPDLTALPGGLEGTGATVRRGRRSRPSSRERRPLVAVLLTAAVAVLVAGVGIGGWQLLQPRAQAQELAGALDRIESAPDTARVAVATGGAADLAGTELVYSDSRGEAVVTGTDDLPALDDRVYALWRLDDAGGAELAGRFTDGRGSVLEGGADGAAAVAVTIEPEDVGDAPTTPVVALYDLGA